MDNVAPSFDLSAVDKRVPAFGRAYGRRETLFCSGSPKQLWRHLYPSDRNPVAPKLPFGAEGARMHSYERFNRGLVRQYHKWMIAMHYVKTTQTVYLRTLRQYLQYLGMRSVTTARHTDIRLFIAHASENGATLATVYRSLGVLRQFYDFLNLGGVVDYVAPRFVRLRVPWRDRRGTLTHSQMRHLIATTETPRERALVELFYSTGCRLSEVVNLKIEDVDFTAQAGSSSREIRKAQDGVACGKRRSCSPCLSGRQEIGIRIRIREGAARRTLLRLRQPMEIQVALHAEARPETSSKDENSWLHVSNDVRGS